MRKGVLFWVSILFLTGMGYAQTPASDSLFTVAQNLSFKNHFAQSETIMQNLVATYPKDYDYAAFYGALLSWEHKYDSSKSVLRGVISKDPKNVEAYDALTNAEIWTKEDSTAIIDATTALTIPKVNVVLFQLKIAEAQKDMQKFPPAYAIVDSVLAKNPGDTNAKNLYKDIHDAQVQKTADSLFDSAQKMTATQRFKPAEKIMSKLSPQYPKNTDYKVLWGRLLCFNHKIDTSEIILKEVLVQDPKNLEAFDALADDELIATHFKSSVQLADSGLDLPVKGDRTSLLITKGSAQDNLELYYEALTTIDTLVTKDSVPGEKHDSIPRHKGPYNKEATDLYKIIKVHILIKKADSLFTEAQKDATAKRYNDAKIKLDTILRWFPDNMEYLLFKGRVYTWEKKYDTAIGIINKVIKKEPHSMDAYDALTDAELWKPAYLDCIRDIDKALEDSMFRGYPTMKLTPKKDSATRKRDSIHSDSIKKGFLSKDTTKKFVNKDSNAKKYYSVFMLKRAHACYNMEDWQGTINTLDTMRKVDSTNPEANKLLTEAKIKNLKNVLSAGYLNNSFAPPYGPLHFAWLQYMRNFRHCPVYGKVTYGSEYGSPTGWHSGLQYTIGAFPKITPAAYAEVGVSYSNSYAVFPKWQINADVYQKLGKGFEVSVGGIYMYFIDVVDEPPTPPQNVWIFDPGINYYYKEHWQFSYKPYFSFKSGDVFVTHTGMIRHFFGNEDTWVSIYGTIGKSQFVDFYYPNPLPTAVKLVGIDYQTRLPHNWLIWPMLSYEYEEYYAPANLWRNVYFVQIIITKRF